MTKLYEHEHPYMSAGDGEEYESWDDFISEWGSVDEDYNLVYRFDWEQGDPNEARDDPDSIYGKEHIRIAYLHQRKGTCSVQVVIVSKDDEPAIREWLETKFAYLKTMWTPL